MVNEIYKYPENKYKYRNLTTFTQEKRELFITIKNPFFLLICLLQNALNILVIKSYLNDGFTLAPFDLFDQEQKDNMPKTYMPEFIMKENYLSCDNPYNPRSIWASLQDLNVDDITEIYRELGIITIREETSESRVHKSSMVLMPKEIKKDFIKQPNVSCIESLSCLNVSCIHRENIRLLYGGPKNVISKSYPHLILGDSLNLVENNIKLDGCHLLEILTTCIDLANSSVCYFCI